jgi:hypothetical protein
MVFVCGKNVPKCAVGIKIETQRNRGEGQQRALQAKNLPQRKNKAQKTHQKNRFFAPPTPLCRASVGHVYACIIVALYSKNPPIMAFPNPFKAAASTEDAREAFAQLQPIVLGILETQVRTPLFSV